jgi:hypothetical protein
MSKLTLSAAGAAPALIVACAGIATASPIATQPTSIFVSGTAGGPLSSIAGLDFTTFDRPLKSPDGSYWMLLARNTTGTSTDAMYISGAGATGSLRVQEGVTLIDGARIATNMSERTLGINNAGQWAVGLDLDGATSDDRVIALGQQTPGITIGPREGQINPATGLAYATSQVPTRIQSDGQAAFGWTIASGSTTNDQGLFTNNGSTLVAREGTHFTNLTFGSFNINADGSQWSYQADIIGAPGTSNNAFFVNNTPVLREGFEVAASMPSGTYGTIQTISLPTIDGASNWFARGRNNDGAGTGWAVRNGEVIAKGGDLVGGDYAGEQWSGTPWNAAGANNVTFFQASGDSSGNYVIGGFTDNADTSVNGVWMYNGVTEILRLGDQVDIDADGILDDAFIYNASFFASPTALGGFLSDDGFFYTTVDIRNGAGDALGQSFLRIAVPAPGAITAMGLGALACLRRHR